MRTQQTLLVSGSRTVVTTHPPTTSGKTTRSPHEFLVTSDTVGQQIRLTVAVLFDRMKKHCDVAPETMQASIMQLLVFDTVTLQQDICAWLLLEAEINDAIMTRNPVNSMNGRSVLARVYIIVPSKYSKNGNTFSEGRG